MRIMTRIALVVLILGAGLAGVYQLTSNQSEAVAADTQIAPGEKAGCGHADGKCSENCKGHGDGKCSENCKGHADGKCSENCKGHADGKCQGQCKGHGDSKAEEDYKEKGNSSASDAQRKGCAAGSGCATPCGR